MGGGSLNYSAIIKKNTGTQFYQLQNNTQRVSSCINVKFAFISLEQIYCIDSYRIGKG